MTTYPESSMTEDHWLRRAFENHSRELHVHCYRLSGNVTDADDLLQETFARAWRSRAGYERRASARTWLYRIATNVFLDSRKATARRMVPVGDIYEWSTELGPYPDALSGGDPEPGGAADEIVELALIAALMYLPARQRAAFVLRDIHGWTPAEIADVLGASLSTTNSLLQRARAMVRRHAPADREDWRRPELTSSDQELLRRYAAARSAEDFRALLVEDVRITMPPDEAVRGIDTAAEFLSRPLDWHTIQSSANGRPAMVCYLRRPGSPHYEALVVDVLHVVDGKIAEINAFVGARHAMAFGLPATLDPPLDHDSADDSADRLSPTTSNTKEHMMDMKLELVPIPVTDVDRAKEFYVNGLGFVEDVDVRPAAGVRVVQLTPPGSQCSIGLGTGLPAYDEAPPGSIKALHLVVDDIEKARTELIDRGVQVGPVQDVGGGVKYAGLEDPDGNSLTLQEMSWRTGESF